MLNGGKGDGAAKTLKNIFSSPALLACLAGVFFNLTGLSRLIFGSPVGPVINSIIAMLTKSITPLILIVVGYGFKLSRSLLPAVLKTSAMRLLISIPVCALALLALSLFGVTDETVRFAVIFVSALPAPFSTSVYAKDDLQQGVYEHADERVCHRHHRRICCAVRTGLIFSNRFGYARIT